MLKTKEQIESWLNKYNIKNYTINDDLSVNVDGSVYLQDKNLTEIPVSFNKVNGGFYCSYNKLTSLVGSPKEVLGSFWCYSNKLTSLEGCPEKVNGHFSCFGNPLKSLNCSLKGVGGIGWRIKEWVTIFVYFLAGIAAIVASLATIVAFLAVCVFPILWVLYQFSKWLEGV